MAETAARQVIGFAWGGPNTKDYEYDGELRQIAVLPAYQGRGIGRLLVCHVARYLIELGMHRMMVEVLRVNPNRLFYEHLGATYVSEHPYNWDGVILSSCVYGWADIRPLLTDHCEQARQDG